ncbi:MAG TPA: glycosyltransferase, partial [Candidatus Dormibacteraeota bacterium]|nr:glycosyltransferase [Candidatus Dormibacteraeota bacterium]
FPWAGSRKPLVDFSLTSPRDLMGVWSLLQSGERELRTLIASDGVDACLALWAVPAGYLAWRTCPPRIPYAVWALGSDVHTWARRPLIGSLVRRVLRSADHRFADGLELADEVHRITRKGCDFLPSTRRLPQPMPAPEPLSKGVRFLFVGRLEPVKGADVIIDAMGRLARSGVEASLYMCGGGHLESTLRKEVAASGAHVTFLGPLRGDAVAGYMKACDCVVIPSRMESIPIVFSEALQADVPLLVTDVGDMGKLARDHGLAEPVPPDDAAALASAMDEFARDVARQRARYETARAGLLKLFDIGATADRYLASLGA